MKVARRISLFLLGIIFLFIFTAAAVAATANFSDVSTDHPHAFAIRNLAELEIVKGYADQTFRPESKVTRAEALALILKASKPFRQQRAIIETAEIPFSDIQEGMWFREFIEEGVALNIISGYGDKTFKPLEGIRLQEALKMGLLAFSIVPPGVNATGGASVGPWYEPYFSFSAEKKLVDPNDDGKFSPHEFLTRSQIAELIFRIKFLKEQGKPFDRTVEWKMFSHDSNFFEIKYPVTWKIFKGSKHSVVWKPDVNNGQVWMTRVTPVSARLSISFVEDSSLTSAVAWFGKIRKEQLNLYGPNISAGNPDAPLTQKFVTFREVTAHGKSILLVDIVKRNLFDAYLFLSPGKGLVFYGETGNSNLMPFLKEQLETIIRSYRFIEPKPPAPPALTPAQKLEKVREAILIEGKGPEILKLLSDKIIIETDAIGVGTGPVDYSYSQELNATIKYERNSKTILNVQEGRTSAF